MDKVFIDKKITFRVIFGDSSDQQGCQSLCFLKNNGRFDTYWDVMTDILHVGGWDEDDSCFEMTYGKIIIDYVNRKGQSCQKVYDGTFHMGNEHLVFEKGKDRNTHTFFMSLIGCEVKAHFQFALNEDIFKIHLEKKSIEDKISKQDRIEVKPTSKKGMKI